MIASAAITTQTSTTAIAIAAISTFHDSRRVRSPSASSASMIATFRAFAFHTNDATGPTTGTVPTTDSPAECSTMRATVGHEHPAWTPARITIADVEVMVARTREGNIFHLTDAVGRGDAAAALAALAQMFSAGEKETGVAMQVLAMLTRQIRMIYTAKVGGPGAFGSMPSFVTRQFETQARGFSEARLRSAYAALVRLDSDLKGGSYVAYATPFMALQRWILDTCRALPGVDART